jgi:hypothetical protein
MRQLNLIIITILVSASAFGQSERWKQKNARINFAVTPLAEYVKIAGTYSPAASLSGAISFNDTYFVGGYITKKVMTHNVNYEILPTMDLDANFQHVGAEFQYAMKLGLYRTKGGHYVHPKIRITFGTKMGAGMVWLDSTKVRYTKTDYFGYVEPMVGVSYPLSDYITLQGGVCFTAAIKIQKLGAYFQEPDFTMAGAYLGFRFTVFR